MPQTRYVLMRALRLGLRPIVVREQGGPSAVRPARRPGQDLRPVPGAGATDAQADFPVVYGSALEGWIVRDPDNDPHEGMDALFETIIADAPPPQVDYDAPFRMQISTLAWSDYLGRIGLRPGARRGCIAGARSWCARPPAGTSLARGDDDWEIVGIEKAPAPTTSGSTRGARARGTGGSGSRRHRVDHGTVRLRHRGHALGTGFGCARASSPRRSKSPTVSHVLS